MSEAIGSKTIVLCVLDGWGEGAPGDMNAISQAHTPCWDMLRSTYPHSLLETSGESVGLPDGQMGNSEVGHTTLGAGRVFLQDLPRISESIAKGEFSQDPHFLEFVETILKGTGVCHVMGLLSPGGVHSHQDHLIGVCHALARSGVVVWIHLFGDGRDVPPKSIQQFLTNFEESLAGYEGKIRIATLTGRYYAMDRDKRWDRTDSTLNTFISPIASPLSPQEAVSAFYQDGISDEFFTPTAFQGFPGIQENDGLFMANFRSDRIVQLLSGLLLRTPATVTIGPRLSMTLVSESLTPVLPALFPPKDPSDTLGEVLAKHGKTQLRLAETEKFAHVTYFFNGGKEVVFPGEDRLLIPSPHVAQYDEAPEMSAREVTDALVDAIGRYDFILVNYANPDMIGHTGNFNATVQAIEFLDQCLQRVFDAAILKNATLLITADHGNAETMEDPNTHQPHTSHTLLPVPCVLVHHDHRCHGVRPGILADIAPTVLSLMNIPAPLAMTGRSLVITEGS